MSLRRFVPAALAPRALIAIVFVASLAACSSGSPPPKPTPLAPNEALIGVRQVWTAHVGPVDFPLDVNVNGNTVTLAGAGGTVAAIDARTGRDLWRTSVRTPIAAGVGSDGKLAAVVTTGNELVALQGGRELWRQKLQAQAYTAPLVAGARVFVLAADRSVSAYDGQSGRRLWLQKPPSEPLILRQGGVLLAVGDTLVVGLSGRMVGLNPLNGSLRWEAPIASPRGTNDIERLADLVSPVSRVGNEVCARAFQTAVGCVDAVRGAVLWTRPANGAQGLQGDDRLLFGTEMDGKVVAWRRANGEQAWSTDSLKYRGLSAPLALGRSVVVGDSAGFVHLLSREDGSLLTRLTTDGSAVVAAPVAAGNTLVVVTRNGGVYGFQPE
ncbi:outer membrane protein assembly factor BamB [Polaromonas sp. C04]|uniref:outer membrane protein assembly factor BamB n=1 Tax=Polaromonas sp. C04 TaxID=1945857 RepID=UPI0009869EF9|nr:outer membrane protein assembly factor BamB [Polaromonas sp. C04]OOG51909.1 outer membrane protein assembly factor BamB [Polaromonas sp. C04]